MNFELNARLFWTAPKTRICSNEHENTFTPSLGAHIAEANRQASAAGIKFMESPPKTLKASLEAIREIARNALNQMGESQHEHSMRWKCKNCQYIKYFTRPVSLETAGRCPRCKSTEFKPV